jgi:hypothetical protein
MDIIKGINQSSFTSVEKDITNKVPALYRGFGVKCFEDSFGRKRFVIEGVSGLLIDKSRMVEHVFTVESEQKKGYASGLVAAAKATLKAELKFDGNFSDAGKKLFKVED